MRSVSNPAALPIFARFGFSAWALFFMWAAGESAQAAPVGYVNILNGADPASAFVVERGEASIVPEGGYTDLEDGDFVVPGPGAVLLFTPLDVGCEPVELYGRFKAGACPPQGDGLGDKVFDFVSGQYLAAPEREVGLTVTRGDGDERLWSLPPSPPLVYVENPELAATLEGLPLLALTADRSAARVAVLGADQVSLVLAGGQSGPPIDWRLDPAAFRGALWRRINYLAMADLAGGALWPDLEWVINVLAPAQAGPVEHQGLRWSVSDKIVVDGGEPLGTVEVDRPSLLTFQVINRGSGAHYAYIVNYNGQGQLLQVLPPEGAKNVLHRVGPGQTLDLGHIRLELGAPEEAVRIILSERPLDMARFSQDGLDVPSEPRQAVLRPAPKGSWSTAVQVFKFK